jgi:uncharacterized protein (DUF1800 family)
MERLRASLAVLLCAQLGVSSVPAGALSAPSVRSTTDGGRPYQSGELHGDDRILQALNRFTFGPRPGDLEAVRVLGLEKWFARQLRPETIDNSALEVRLAQFPAMQWNTQQLLVRLPSNAMIRQAADGKVPIPNEDLLRAVYVDEIRRYQNRQQKKELEKLETAQGANASMSNPARSATASNNPGRSQESPRPSAASVEAGQGMSPAGGVVPTLTAPVQPVFTQAQITRILTLAPDERVARLAALEQPEFDSFRKSLKGSERNTLNAGLTPAQKETVAALESPQRLVNDELVAQRLTRDIYSNAQLQEVMTDFWLNHFNVYLHKNDETPYYLVSYERDVIRPRALGKFEDLLKATAQSPAMLLYLDNSASMGPDSPAAEKARLAAARRPNAQKAAPQGLNENYARELMELHTLGVNGGYTQADVTQVARVLTGWTVDKPQRGGGFKFDDSRHQPGTKKVLGKKIKDHGQQEGEQLLHLLATRPATARFLSRKLAIRFVGDDPAETLVDRMAKTYLKSDGDISAVLKTLFHSPELWAPDSYRAKVKTPLEYVVSAARASNAEIDNLQPLAKALSDMGMPVYGAVPPTGYKWDASDWVSTGALVNRMNFALALAANKLPGIAITWSPQTEPLVAGIDDGSVPSSPVQSRSAGYVPGPLPSPDREEQRLEASLVDGGLSAGTRAAVLDQFNQQSRTQSQQTPLPARPTPAPAKPMNPTQAAAALEKQDQLLAGLLLGSPEFQRR